MDDGPMAENRAHTLSILLHFILYTLFFLFYPSTSTTLYIYLLLIAHTHTHTNKQNAILSSFHQTVFTHTIYIQHIYNVLEIRILARKTYRRRNHWVASLFAPMLSPMDRRHKSHALLERLSHLTHGVTHPT